jgi:hypothetical protein
MAESLANEPRVIVMLLATSSAAGSWGLGGPLMFVFNPLTIILFCWCVPFLISFLTFSIMRPVLHGKLILNGLAAAVSWVFRGGRGT